MAISFEIPQKAVFERQASQMLAEGLMRPMSRELDENEHTRPTMFIEAIWPVVRDGQARDLDRHKRAKDPKRKPSGPSYTITRMALMIEMLSWGDAGAYLCMPGGSLGGAAIEAAGTPEQKERFLRRYAEGNTPNFGAMAMTEPNAGSDTANISTTAVLDEETNEWVLNGEKIFVTNGKLAFDESNGLIIIWATMDKSAGRAGMKSFVLEAGTPGAHIVKQEHKHGIRASDTASLVLDNCRLPYDNILGSPEVRKRDKSSKGFKSAMATFDATRPLVASSALGIARAAIETVKEVLKEEGVEIRYGAARYDLGAVERDVLEMEAQHKAAWLLTLRALAMLDNKQQNSLESSMCKAKAGKVVTLITQKAVEILGPLGYSREMLLEKWMRDGKINDLFEGTGQINLLVVARRILGYSSRELK